MKRDFLNDTQDNNTRGQQKRGRDNQKKKNEGVRYIYIYRGPVQENNISPPCVKPSL